MPNSAAVIYESIWRGGDWRKLTRGAQCLYMQLCSQKELDCAGLLPLQPMKWVKGCDAMTLDQLWADMDELQDHRFVFYDVDTDEVLIRKHLHQPFIIKIPNCRASAMRAAKLCASPHLRAVLAAELRASGREDFVATADEIDPHRNPSETLPEPYPPNPIGTVSEPYPNPIETVSEPFPNPIENNPIDRVPIGTGMGTGTGKPTFTSGTGGEAPPQCTRHPNGNPTDTPCRGCADARRWDEQHADDTQAAQARAEAEQRRAAAQAAAAAILDCPLCDTDGYRLPGCRQVCDHTDRTDTTRNGLARARAALKATRTSTTGPDQ